MSPKVHHFLDLATGISTYGIHRRKENPPTPVLFGASIALQTLSELDIVFLSEVASFVVKKVPVFLIHVSP